MPVIQIYRTMNLGDEIEVEIEVDFSYDSYGAPPMIGRPPELCDPGEPVEITIEGSGAFGVEIGLTGKEEEEVNEWAAAHADENLPDWRDYGDRL